jgi:O-antigen/teichoic acid export membrane protein
MPEGSIDKKYFNDASWNYLSFLIQAGSGVLINFLIIFLEGAEALGVFNQLYAIYVVTGQVAVWGLHDSVLKHTAQYTNSEEQDILCTAACCCVTFTGAIGAILLFLSSNFIGDLFQSENVQKGIYYLSPGIFFFVVNKVLIAIFNGKRQMKQFALASSIRALSILLFCAYFVYTETPNSVFGLAFTFSEIILFVVVLLLKPTKVLFQQVLFKQWTYRHLNFGTKSVVHGLFSEAFIRVDILMLGIFLSDQYVGIYSFAAFFVEGIYQIPVVIRNLNNPILVKMLIKKDIDVLINFTRKTAGLSVCLTSIVSAAVAVSYPFLHWVFPSEMIRESYSVLLVLLGGMVIYSIFIPFDYIFITGGFAGLQSIFMSANMAVNIGFNYVLIPKFGLMGASTATVIAFLSAGLLLNCLSRLYLKLPGGILFKRKLK